MDLRYSPANIEFLDVVVKVEGGMLSTDLFSKPSDSKSYLHYDSDHPHHTKRAIPLGLGMRMRRICSNDEDYRKHKADLKDRLIGREYPEPLVESELKKVDRMNREQLRKGEPKRGNNTVDGRGAPMVVTYSRCLPDIKKILKSKRHILKRSQNLEGMFPADSMVAYRRGRNLKDGLVHRMSRLIMNSGRRTREDCGKGCVICKRTYGGADRDKVRGNKGDRMYDRTIGCRSRNVIYGIGCSKCDRVVYVGETGTSLYARTQNHMSSIRIPNPTVEGLPVRTHFREEGHNIDDAWVVGLERVWGRNAFYRRERERRWIDLMGTYANQQAGGINIRYG